MRGLTLRRPAARSLPLTRTTITVQVLLALLIAGFLLDSMDVRPLGGGREELTVVLPDAAGLDEADRPAVTVAGARAGVVQRVAYDRAGGVARVTVALDEGIRGRLFSDAAARLVPRSALNDLVLEIDPGDPSAGRLADGDDVAAAERAAPTTYDRVLGVFDDDTRAYAQILIGTLRETTRDRPGALRDALRELPDTTDEVTALARRVAERRRTVTRLVGELDQLTTATARRGTQLTSAIGAARRTLEVTAARRGPLREAITDLPATLDEADATLRSLTRLGETAEPALRALRPAARALPGGTRELRRLLPAVDGVVASADRLVTDGRAPIRATRRTVAALGPAARTLVPGIPALTRLVDAIRETVPQIREMTEFWPGTLSVADTVGVTTRALFFRVVDVEPRAFGLTTATPRAETRRLDDLTRRLRALEPGLFTKDRSGPAVVQAARALTADLCRRRHDFACGLVALVDADPPKVIGR